MTPDEYREAAFEQPVMERWQKHLKGRTIEYFRLLPQEAGEDEE